MNWRKQALEKLEAERTAARYDNYAKIMKDRVCETLKDFSIQDGEFAQAVVQGGTFEDCMKDVAKDAQNFGNGHGIPDLEAFRRAVRFYFPGADVKFHMTIDLTGGAGAASDSGTADEGKAVMLNLADFW